jgi:N-acyl-D-aspartate/D-glutamate deacylase
MTDSQNYYDRNADVLREMLVNAYCDVGSGDAGAHVTNNTGYSFPTRMITHWARDRWRGPKLPIEFLVKKQTLDTASLYGLNDRGVIKPGFRADINIIDFDKLRVELPRLVFDMPNGSRRILAESTGYKYTIVKGEVTLKDGKLTGARPGRLVEGEQHTSNDYWQAVRKAVPVAID